MQDLSSSNGYSNHEVSIILGHYAGETYMAAQMSSILSQSHNKLKVTIFDDASPFEKKHYLQMMEFSADPRVHIVEREDNYGFCGNFLRGLMDVDNTSDFYAFSDQDDVWQPDKLKRALDIISKYPSDIPALYCSRTEFVDGTAEKHIGYSSIFKELPSFANALVQNIGGGNTMVMNKAARELVCKANEDVSVVAHDWWVYMLVSGANGNIFYDEQSNILYRQHGGNLIGSNTSIFNSLVRLRMLLNGRFRNWIDRNLTALEKNIQLLAPENQALVNQFAKARQTHFISRLGGLKKLGIYRQSFLDNLVLSFAFFLKKV